jgi:hypothetical protein
VDVLASSDERVSLVVGAGTREVFSWAGHVALHLDWASNTVAAITLPRSDTTFRFTTVYVDAASGRVSARIEAPVVTDLAAGTVVTYDVDAYSLRDLWSGRKLGSWVPAGIAARELRARCNPTFTLSGRSGHVRYDCGNGVAEVDLSW